MYRPHISVARFYTFFYPLAASVLGLSWEKVGWLFCGSDVESWDSKERVKHQNPTDR